MTFARTRQNQTRKPSARPAAARVRATLNDVTAACAEASNVSRKSMCSPAARRTRHIARARASAIVLARMFTDENFRTIADYFGYQSHAGARERIVRRGYHPDVVQSAAAYLGRRFTILRSFEEVTE